MHFRWQQSSEYCRAQGFIACNTQLTADVPQIVLDWLAQLLALPAPFLSRKADGSEALGGGVIQGTASEAAVVALLAARTACLKGRPAEDATKLVVYSSDQVSTTEVGDGVPQRSRRCSGQPAGLFCQQGTSWWCSVSTARRHLRICTSAGTSADLNKAARLCRKSCFLQRASREASVPCACASCAGLRHAATLQRTLSAQPFACAQAHSSIQKACMIGNIVHCRLLPASGQPCLGAQCVSCLTSKLQGGLITAAAAARRSSSPTPSLKAGAAVCLLCWAWPHSKACDLAPTQRQRQAPSALPAAEQDWAMDPGALEQQAWQDAAAELRPCLLSSTNGELAVGLPVSLFVSR